MIKKIIRLAHTSFYLPNMKYNNNLFDFGKNKYLPAGLVHLKLWLPAMKINVQHALNIVLATLNFSVINTLEIVMCFISNCYMIHIFDLAFLLCMCLYPKQVYDIFLLQIDKYFKQQIINKKVCTFSVCKK